MNLIKGLRPSLRRLLDLNSGPVLLGEDLPRCVTERQYRRLAVRCQDNPLPANIEDSPHKYIHILLVKFDFASKHISSEVPYHITFAN